MKNSSCASCPLGPPPDILHIPPPPFPEFLQQSSDFYPNLGALPFPPNLNDSPCKHLCDRHSEGVQYIEMPKQGKYKMSISHFIYFLFFIYFFFLIEFPLLFTKYTIDRLIILFFLFFFCVQAPFSTTHGY